MLEVNNADFEQQREIEKRQAIQRRLRTLGAVFLICVVARIFIKNPEPPKQPRHAGEPLRAMPGMLRNIPEAQRDKISPELLAQLKAADRKQASMPSAVASTPKTESYKPQ